MFFELQKDFVMYRLAKWLLWVVFSVMLTACAGPVPKINLAQDAMANVKTIAVIGAPEPVRYAVINHTHPGMSFGLIGGLAAAADQNEKQEQLSKAYKEMNLGVCRDLADKVADRLSKLGYVATVEAGNWEGEEGKRKLPFNKIKSNADAVLVVSPSIVGFVSAWSNDGFGNDYVPTIATPVFLFGKDREKPIYRGYHITGWKQKAEGWVYTPPSTSFSNFYALHSNPSASADSLLMAASKIADSIAADLRQQGGAPKVAPVATFVQSGQ